jgi:ribonuclease HII
VAAVILPLEPRIKGLNDSKKLPPERREELYTQILNVAVATAVSIVGHDVIDSINILAATMKGMRDAVAQLTPIPELVLVDGNQKPKTGLNEIAIIKGDGKSACVMAAGILAKVTRDRMMRDLHIKYPQYGFDAHKGYGVAMHLEAIRKYGPCPVHRLTFEPVKSFISVTPPTEPADAGEELCPTETMQWEPKASPSPLGF